MARLLVFFWIVFFASWAQAQSLGRVIVTIRPLHSLVQMVLGDTMKAGLLLGPNDSPHSFQMKPSGMRQLQQADVLIAIDPTFETFLRIPLKSLPDNVTVLKASDAPDLILLPIRAGGVWEEHAHSYKHRERGESSAKDLHLWLQPHNAVAIVQWLQAQFTQHYPQHADAFKHNADNAIQEIVTLDQALAKQLTGMQHKPFIVFHDYQYFEARYGLNAVGAITFHPGESPSVARMVSIRKKILDSKAVCVFREPQFSDALVNTAIEGSQAKAATLDPLGQSLEPGPDLYVKLLQQIADQLLACLK